MYCSAEVPQRAEGERPEPVKPTHTTVKHRLNGLFSSILRCLSLQSVRIASEKRLAC